MDAHKNNAIRQNYSAALMSNQKWRKLFLTMVEYGSEFSGIAYRFTDTEKVFYGHAPIKSQVWKDAIDDPVEGLGGPCEYKHIESIHIPNTYHYQRYENSPRSTRMLDLDVFLNALSKVGSFPITRTNDGVTIHGYKR